MRTTTARSQSGSVTKNLHVIALNLLAVARPVRGSGVRVDSDSDETGAGVIIGEPLPLVAARRVAVTGTGHENRALERGY